MSRGGKRFHLNFIARRAVALVALLASGAAYANPGCPALGLQYGHDVAITVSGAGGPIRTQRVFLLPGQAASRPIRDARDAVSFIFDARNVAEAGRVSLCMDAPGITPRKLQLEVPSKPVTSSISSPRLGEPTLYGSSRLRN